ncbi:hypothetical protein BJX96DRAFT_170935 [Aspergillus floccosus]
MASSWIPDHDPKKPTNEKADDVVRRYYNIPRPSPVLQEILNDYDKASLLIDALQRQIALVKCRSQTLEDAQVTIYDKALLALTNNGEDPSDIGALELYLTEFLGIVPILPVAQGHELVSKHLELQSVLDKVLALDPIPCEGQNAPGKENNPANMHEFANTHGTKDHHYRSHRHHDREERHKNEDNLDNKLQTRVERLLSVYHQAKSEFYGAMQRDGMVNIGMARFLRDSAENALRYMLDNGLSDHAYITELEMVFKQARDKAADLLGGRKRHFDEGRDRRRRHRKKGRRVIDSYRPRAKRG